MSKKIDTHVDVSLDKIRVIFAEAVEVIENLKPGEKIPATKLAAMLGEKHNIPGPQLYPTLKFLFDGYPGVLVKRGALGGIIRPAESKDDVPTANVEPAQAAE